jgi:hypothetical protein
MRASEPDAWTDYLNAVEAAARDLDGYLAEGGSPAWPDLVAPEGPLPAGHRERLTVLLALLAGVADRTQTRRDIVKAELDATPHAVATGTGYGSSLDVLG